MAKSFRTLISRMEPEQRARVKTRAEKEIERMATEESRHADGKAHDGAAAKATAPHRKSKLTSQ